MSEFLIAVVVVILHTVGFWLTCRSAGGAPSVIQRSDSLAYVSWATPERAPFHTQIAPSHALMLQLKPVPIGTTLVLSPSANDIDQKSSGRTTPPHPIGPLIGTSAYAIRAGLERGSGATVVLRVEVLNTGKIGRVLTELSGGRHEIDDAAIAYVRALKWQAGRTGESSATIWIRWGVRLDG